MHLILLDIDGTLVDSHEFDSEMYVQAVRPGLDPDAVPLASGTDAVSRVDIMRIAEQQALGGRRASRRTYFGDGVWDRKASLDLGYDFIAIGDRVEHHVRYPDFRCAEAILADLGLGSRE